MAGGSSLRDARLSDAAVAAEMTLAMLADMQRFGGPAPAEGEHARDRLTLEMAREIGKPGVKFLIAETAVGTVVGLAIARTSMGAGALAPVCTAHLSVLYVKPDHRRAGIAGALVARVLEWATAEGAVTCSLNVLVDNPAGALYRRLGFAPHQIGMTRAL